jgi:AraC-like DNA-binding protein
MLAGSLSTCKIAINRFETQQSLLTGLPSVQEVSDHLKVSSRYLTDMLKSLTGQSTQQHIHNG